MIKFISTEDTLPLRNEVLREGKLTLDQCRFPGDDSEDAFHLGYYHGDEPACIATFHKQQAPDSILNGRNWGTSAYQLRGMATSAAHRGTGMGNKLVNFGIVYLRGQKVNYIWCNARKKAFKFYLGLGFEFVSDEFEIAGIGPHKVMYLKIQ